MSAEKVLHLLRASSCFGEDVCTVLPCVCAETIAARIEALETDIKNLAEIIAKQALRIETLKAALREILNTADPYGVECIARAALEDAQHDQTET